jgi:hypothetical protein
MALAAPSGFCSAGRIGIVVTGLLGPAVTACRHLRLRDGPTLRGLLINVAAPDLMTNPGRQAE